MKTIVRASVLALAVIGFAASSNVSPTSAKTTVLAKVSAAPTPMCPPNSPNGCNIRGGW